VPRRLCCDHCAGVDAHHGDEVTRSRAQRPPAPPGTITRRFRPKFHYELLVCGIRGHVLVGTDAEEVGPEDSAFVRVYSAMRWYRCLRCDAWVPLPPPVRTRRRVPPSREEITLPTRGRALRDKVVLRLIAVDRALHFLILGSLAALAFLLASHRGKIVSLVDRLNVLFFGARSGTTAHPKGFLHELERLATLDVTTFRLIGAAAAAYALLEGTEALGLWFQRRWAEYLTFLATTLFVPYELYELAEKITAVRVGAFAINVAILLYLLVAKRLFGLRGGAAADRAAREADSGWDAFERLTPGELSD
jgi:uncharacterized membrane protein (DUF2068 family)